MTLESVLDSVNETWFGKSFQDINAVDIQGDLSIQLSAAALQSKVGQYSQGRAGGGFAKDGKVTVQIQSTVFANSDFRTEMTGSFGHVLWTRVGNRGFLYSQEQNAYTTRVDPGPTDSPLSYLGWFCSLMNDIKAVYVHSPVFKASLGKEKYADGRTLQTLVFDAPTSSYDFKKREQGLADSLGFWKRGHLEVRVDKAMRLPHSMIFTNEGQGIRTQMDFSYDDKGRPLSIAIRNQSRGMEGPGFIKIGYANGLMNHISGELSSQDKKVDFDLNLTWAKGRSTSSIISVPPPTASKRSYEDLEIALLSGLAQNILELQRSGLNLRSINLGKKK